MSTIEGEKENCASHYELILVPKFLFWQKIYCMIN